MKFLRVIMPVVAFVTICATGAARAADESAQPVQIAQAQNEAQSGDARPSTLGDLRHFESRMDERMTRLENRMDTRIERLEDRIIQMFIALLTVMVALYGLPHLPSWWNRLRASGKPAAAAGVLLAVLAVMGAGAAIAAVV